jgi:hypothetical protein
MLGAGSTITPFSILSEDSDLHRPLGAGPITASGAASSRTSSAPPHALRSWFSIALGMIFLLLFLTFCSMRQAALVFCNVHFRAGLPTPATVPTSIETMAVAAGGPVGPGHRTTSALFAKSQELSDGRRVRGGPGRRDTDE